MNKQGRRADFVPRDSSMPPNSWRCHRCDRRYASQKTLARHEKDVHGIGVTTVKKYPCPRCPSKMFSRRSELREHYQAVHPGADQDDADEADAVMVSIPRTMPNQSREQSKEPPSANQEHEKLSRRSEDSHSPSINMTSREQSRDRSLPSSSPPPPKRIAYGPIPQVKQSEIIQVEQPEVIQGEQPPEVQVNTIKKPTEVVRIEPRAEDSHANQPISASQLKAMAPGSRLIKIVEKTTTTTEREYVFQ